MNCCFKNFFHNLFTDHCFTNNRLPTPFDPVHGSRFFVRAKVSYSNWHFITHSRIHGCWLLQHMKLREMEGLPDMPITSMSGKSFWRKSNTFWTPFDTMFIPIASPVLQVNLMYRFFPAIEHWMFWSLPNLLDLFIVKDKIDYEPETSFVRSWTYQHQIWRLHMIITWLLPV